MSFRLLVGLALTLMVARAPLAAQDGPPASTPALRIESRAGTEGGRLTGEVLVNNEVFLQVRAGVGNYSAVRRAELVAERLQQLADRGMLGADLLRTERVDGVLLLLAGETAVVTLDRGVVLGPGFERLTALPRLDHPLFIYGKDDARLADDLRSALGTPVDALPARGGVVGLQRYPLVVLGPEVPDARRLLGDYAGPVVAMGPNGLKYLRSRDPAWNSVGGLVLLDVRAPDRSRLRLYHGAVYSEMVAPGDRTVLARSGEGMVVGGSGDLWYWGYEATDKPLTDQGRALLRELVEHAKPEARKR